MGGIQVLIFDFDGTLIQSNKLKYEAYFKIFPDDEFHHRVIEQVLKNDFEFSRFIIIEKILNILDTDNHKSRFIDKQLNKLAEHYNAIVLEGAKKCPAMPDALKVLETLAPIRPLYLSSTTPETELKRIIRYRGWEKHFKNIYGYPRNKTETVKTIIAVECVTSDKVLVVGDGDSDRLSAKNAGAKFFHVTSQTDFAEIIDIIGYDNV